MENATQERARLSFDLGDDEDEGLSRKEIITKKVQEVSEKSGFTATSRAAPRSEKTPAPKSGAGAARRDRRRRSKTGRTYPFNTKLREETYQTICSLADAATIKENRPVSLAESIERGVEALQGKRTLLAE